MKTMSSILEMKPQLITFFCSFPNKYSCFLQVLLVACRVEEKSSKNKLVEISKLSFTFSFSQLESLEKVSWLFPMVKLSAVKAVKCSRLCGKSAFHFLHASFPWKLRRSVMHQKCTWDGSHALLLSDPAVQCPPAEGYVLELSLEK